ncbi:MAG: hypothetical protein ACYDC0_16305 [Acidimicrobiales bacterium]
MTYKVAGIPAWIIAAGVVVLAYLYFKHQASSSSSTGNAPAATIINTGGFIPSHHYRRPLPKQPPTGGALPTPNLHAHPFPNPTMQPTTVNSQNYPLTLSNGQGVTVIGKMLNSTGRYAGENVSGGAPVYAYTNGTWAQDFNARSLPAGTPLATLNTFAGDIGNPSPKGGEQL